MSLNSELRRMCREVRPPDAFTEHCLVTVKSVLALLARRSRFTISHFVIGGGLPAGKDTSTCLKADADVTLFVPLKTGQAQSSLASWIPHQKELILDDWWRILFDHTEPDNWNDVIERTTNSLTFCYKGVMIDLLVAFLFHTNSEEQRYYIWRLMRVTYGLSQIPGRQEKSNKLKRKLQNELSSHGVKWMRSKSKFVSHAARLAKFWSQTVLFVGCGSGKSFLIELIAAATALEVEERSNSDEYLDFFRNFLTKVSDIMTLKIIFTDHYSEQDVPGSLLSERPLLLNPVNPFQNVFEVADETYLKSLELWARETLRRLHLQGGPDMVSLFRPQMGNNILTYRHTTYRVEESDGEFMPTLTFNSEWLKPLLNKSCERILSDKNKLTRYYVARSVRLIGSVVKCCVFSGHGLDSILTKIEKVMCDLNCRKQENFTIRRENSEESGAVKDVAYRVPLHDGKEALTITFDVISNIRCDEVPAFRDK